MDPEDPWYQLPSVKRKRERCHECYNERKRRYEAKRVSLFGQRVVMPDPDAARFAVLLRDERKEKLRYG